MLAEKPPRLDVGGAADSGLKHGVQFVPFHADQAAWTNKVVKVRVGASVGVEPQLLTAITLETARWNPSRARCYEPALFAELPDAPE